MKMILLAGFNMDDGRSTYSILSSAINNYFISATNTVASIFSLLTYENVESILRQCHLKYSQVSSSNVTYHASTPNISTRQILPAGRGIPNHQSIK